MAFEQQLRMTLWSVLDLLLGRWNPAKVMRDSGTMKWWWLVGSEAAEAVLQVWIGWKFLGRSL